jgi:hypothetical protein
MDLGIITAQVRRVGVATDLRLGVERVGIAIRLALPLVEAEGSAATAELARDLRALARTRSEVALLLPAARASDGSAARLDLGGRQVPLSPALRDALLTAAQAAGASATGASAATPGAAAVAPGAAAALAASSTDAALARAWATGAQTTAAAAQMLSGSGAARSTLRVTTEPTPDAQARWSQPLLQRVEAAEPVGPIVERLRQALETSGLFFESHLAQWNRGERSDAALRQEVLGLLAGAQPGAREAAGHVPGGAERVAAQMDVLQRQSVVLQGPVWAGQALLLELAREQDADDRAAAAGAAPAPPVFHARLKLDLPRLGVVEVELRLAGHSVAVEVHAAEPALFDQHLAELAGKLEARGLKAAQVSADTETAE